MSDDPRQLALIDDPDMEDLVEIDVDLSTPLEEYPHLADVVIHAVEVASAYAEAAALYRVSIDAGFWEHREALAERTDVLRARYEACIADIRRRAGGTDRQDGSDHRIK